MRAWPRPLTMSQCQKWPHIHPGDGGRPCQWLRWEKCRHYFVGLPILCCVNRAVRALQQLHIWVLTLDIRSLSPHPQPSSLGSVTRDPGIKWWWVASELRGSVPVCLLRVMTGARARSNCIIVVCLVSAALMLSQCSLSVLMINTPGQEINFSSLSCPDTVYHCLSLVSVSYLSCICSFDWTGCKLRSACDHHNLDGRKLYKNSCFV